MSASAYVGLALVTLVAPACAEEGARLSGPVPGPSPSATTQSTPDTDEERFHPPTYSEGDRTVLPLTFPDGTTAELVYPPDLSIESAGGIQPLTSFARGCQSDITGFFGSGYRGMSGAEEPIATHRDVAGQPVEEWPDTEADTDEEPEHYLTFRFGRWSALIHAFPEDVRTCAVQLRGRETPDGWLILEGVAPARLAAAGEHAGPELMFTNVQGHHERWLLLFPGRCTPGEVISRDRKFANWCDRGGSMRIHVYSDGLGFIRQVERELKIRRVRLAS